MSDKEKEEKELAEAVDTWLGRFIMLKWAGFGVFGLSLALFVLSSLIQIFWLPPLLTNALLIGIGLIIIGVIGEKVLTQ